jgi:hypothetical protein
VPLLSMKPSLETIDDSEELELEDSEEDELRTAALVVAGGWLVDEAAGGRPVAGIQSDPPHVSPTGQQAVTPLNTHVGCAASQVTEQSPTPLDEKHAAPPGQQPDPSGQTVSVACAQVKSFCLAKRPRPGKTARAVTRDR